jgi:hypothetical protein
MSQTERIPLQKLASKWDFSFEYLIHNHPIFVPTPSTPLQTKSRPSILQQQSLSIAASSETKGDWRWL